MRAVSSPLGRAAPCSMSREPFFRARVWTVMFSGSRASTPLRERQKPSKLSRGSPAIRSMLMDSKPTSRARA